MKNKKRNKINRFKNDLDWLNPDQEMQLIDEEHLDLAPETFRESISRGIRSLIAVVICIIIPVMWYFDWNTSSITDKTSEVVNGFFDDGKSASIAPEVFPSLPSLPGMPDAVGGNLLEYTSDLNELGLLDALSTPAIRALYENGVTIEYLNDLKQANLIEEFSFPAIIAFHQNQIPLDYLMKLKTQNLIDGLSFPAIIAFYQNSVTTNYLMQLEESGFLQDLSFPAVVAYFKNGVTVEFLSQLENRGLLGEISFPSVVDMYNNQ